MTYPDTLNYLFSRLPFFQREGISAYKPGLDNTLRLDERLGHPHRNYKTIHVAGTNGKGSVSNLLASVLQHAGYKVGLYTSPHLKDFRERIRVDGKPVTEQYVCDFVEKHALFFEDLKPSFFEATMCMAFKFFADEKVDIAVIEVGLGGRLDSTNIISPMLSIITNISFDHQQFLGNTLSAIAGEKAGIMKAGVPVVIGEAEGEVLNVFQQQAVELGVELYLAQELVQVRLLELNHHKQMYDCTGFPNLCIGLGGLYQQKNTATALTAIEQLRKLGLELPDEAVYKGFEMLCETTGLQGRWQVLQTQPWVICDTGHNEAGIRYVLEQIASYSFDKLHFVIGMVNDKDVSKILSMLPKNAEYYFCKASIPRALEPADLQQQAAKFNLKGNTYPSVQSALGAAKSAADKNDFIFVGGSTFVVAEAL